ncbi:hypothetical protein [Komagataeibacter xylinus]|uniref:hypothetical protein n=1 Tax=Komagataeibacter xylinus TaxID=28448 RepID=UPI00280B314F|nr:hypothetical protein [Komagataeibacter xylinus]
MAGIAHAEPDCKGRILVTHPDDYYKKGDIIEYIHTAYDDTDFVNGNMVQKHYARPTQPDRYEVHGGSSYNPKDIEILNCHLVLDASTNEYRLELDDTNANANSILSSTIEDRLNEAGVNHAIASGVAPDAYLNRRQSACGQAVAKVMNGDDSAGFLVETVCK